MKDRREARFLSGRPLREDANDFPKVRLLAGRSEEGADLFVEGDEADAVLLVEDEVGEGGRRDGGRVELAQIARSDIASTR